MSNLEKKEPPRSIIIDNFYYSFKDSLKNDFTYRCKHRRKCNLVIKIEKEEMYKYIEDQNYKVKYIITSTQKYHACNKNENNINEEEPNNSQNFINKKKDLIQSLIYTNIEKPLSFHCINLQTNNIYLKKNQIKWILQKIRENKFPSDIKYLNDISKIRITYDKEINLTNLPFCYKNVNILNKEKNNKLEKYSIFTSIFQIKLITKCKQIFIDGTFKISPVGYYQVLDSDNIIFYDEFEPKLKKYKPKKKKEL